MSDPAVPTPAPTQSYASAVAASQSQYQPNTQQRNCRRLVRTQQVTVNSGEVTDASSSNTECRSRTSVNAAATRTRSQGGGDSGTEKTNVEGARRVWGTLREATVRSVKVTLNKVLTLEDSDGISVHRKYKHGMHSRKVGKLNPVTDQVMLIQDQN